MIKKFENLDKIKSRLYKGYVWGSNGIKLPNGEHEKIPYILENEKFDSSIWNANNPYIVEGWLNCKNNEENISIYIKHTGTYQIYEYDLNNLPEGSETHSVQYLSHRLGKLKKVNFQQLWIPEKDKNCEDMKVLKMKALIFTGFDNTKKQENVS